MRIVAGHYRGRPLLSPPDGRIRPTSDRVREAVFNLLAHSAYAIDLDGAAVIDLFAGSGALGIEALSRGAGTCLFVETDATARGIIRDNIDGLGLGGTTRIFRRDATDLGPTTRPGGYDLALMDPPYGLGLTDRALASLSTGGWLKPGALVVVEERAGCTIAWPAGLTELDLRAYGDTVVRIGRMA